jgi:hypothetical protein
MAHKVTKKRTQARHLRSDMTNNFINSSLYFSDGIYMTYKIDVKTSCQSCESCLKKKTLVNVYIADFEDVGATLGAEEEQIV